MRYIGRAIVAVSPAQRDDLWHELVSLHAKTFAIPIGAGNNYAVPVLPAIRVLARHLRGEKELRRATVVAIMMSAP